MSKMGKNPPAIATKDIHKSYRLGATTLEVLRGVSLQVAAGEFVAVIGASGSGKSTLLHLVGLLDRANEGTVHLHGQNVTSLRAAKRNAIRCRDVGFVFQFYHLLPELTVLENVLLPTMVDSSLAGWFARRGPLRKRARELLESLGLGERLKHRPKELSGGERQRVALARALINQPSVLLADEPTGNLDSQTGRQIMEVLGEFHRRDGQTILMVTHDSALAHQADRILHLVDGKLLTKAAAPKS